MITAYDYISAIHSQSAVNLSGLVHSLAEIIDKIRREPDFDGTNFVNTHPIVRLFAEQIYHLAFQHRERDDDEKYYGQAGRYHRAYTQCVMKAGISCDTRKRKDI